MANIGRLARASALSLKSQGYVQAAKVLGYGDVRIMVTQLLPKGRPARGIVVRNENGAVALELYVVVAYGLNLAEVAATVRSQVTYEVERLTGLRVASVDVHIQDVKRTA